MEYVLIIGAKSDIAKDIAREYANHGYNIYLAARESYVLEDFAQDIRIRTGKKIIVLELDILDEKNHQSFYFTLPHKPIGVISAVGYLGKQESAQTNFSEAKKIIETNFTALVNLFEIIADDFASRKYGFMIGISSVAGDRGRKSNYIYGAAKAAFSTYLSGLRNRLYEKNVYVMTVKPGFVATKMTEGMNLPSKLTAKTEEVARDIYAAQQKHKDILYTKSIWRWIMLIIRNIPEFKFKKMSL